VPELDGMLSTMGCSHLRRATTFVFQGRWDLACLYGLGTAAYTSCIHSCILE